MSRYIDADALREKVLYHADTMNHAGNHEQAKAFNYCLCMIDDAPTAGRKRGIWMPIEQGDKGYSAGDFICSCCGKPNKCYSVTDYCCSCGAKMERKR